MGGWRRIIDRVRGVTNIENVDSLDLIDDISNVVNVESLDLVDVVGQSNLYLWDDEGNAWGKALADPSTGALIRISHQHHEVHEGNSYFAAVNATLNSGNTISIAITTPDTTLEPHLVVDARSSDSATFAYIHEVTSYTGGNAYTPHNRNGRSANVSACTVKTGYTGNNPLVLTGGTTLFSELMNSAKGIQWERRSGEEIILPRNKIEVFRVTAGANSMTITILCNWYEHAPV